MNRPLIAVIIGDPAGIGPEVVLKAMTSPAVLAAVRPLVIGDRGVLDQAGSCGLGVSPGPPGQI